jgi:quercetin dioxygenase-like cupin family protein
MRNAWLCLTLIACAPSQELVHDSAAHDVAPTATPRFMPLGPIAGDVEILHGHPDSTGPFAMRILELAGTIVPPHTHPVDEHITVVKGTWYFGIGETFDSTALRKLKTGDYAFAPKGTTMFAMSPDEAVVQIHGNGPFHIDWRNGFRSLADSASGFAYRIGERVVAERGRGVISQGYASGDHVQYEIQRADGSRFMALERSVRRE